MYYYIEPNLLIKESEVEAIKIQTSIEEVDMCLKCFIYTKSNKTFDFIINRKIIDIVTQNMTTNSNEIEKLLIFNFLEEIKKEETFRKFIHLKKLLDYTFDKTIKEIQEIQNEDNQI